VKKLDKKSATVFTKLLKAESYPHFEALLCYWVKRELVKRQHQGLPMEVKKLDKKSAAVFTKLLKAESYPHFEARSMLLGEKGTGKTTAPRTTHGGEQTGQIICSCVHKITKSRKLSPL
jgi:hypothetical protein